METHGKAEVILKLRVRAFGMGTVSLHRSTEGKEAALSCPFKTQAEEALGLRVLQISDGLLTKKLAGQMSR